MSKSKVTAHVAAQVQTVNTVASLAFNATQGGIDAARAARELWGAEFPTLKPKSVERVEFNAKVLDAWLIKNRENVPTVVRKMGEYRLLEKGETAEEGTATTLTPAYVMGYAGNALTKLKKETPTLGNIVDKVKTYYQGVYADTWRNLCESYVRLQRQESGESKGRGANGPLKPYGDRLPKYVDRILTANTAAFERGDTTAYDPTVMDRALAAFAKSLKG